MAVKYTFKEWKGEKPQTAGGKERQPNPFDDIVKKSFDEKKSFGVTVPHETGKERKEELGAVVRLLRGAAAFHKLSVNVRILEPDTVWFEAVAKRSRPRKPGETTDAPQSDLPNATHEREESAA